MGYDARLVFRLLFGEVPVHCSFNLARLLQELWARVI